MKKYSVIFHPDAETDINSSYQWGRRVWGGNQANAWARELQRTIKLRLTSLPLSCPLAPECDDLGIAVRQLIVQRYRVLFIVEKRAVKILHVQAHMPLALIHAKGFRNSLNCEQIIGRGGLEVRIDVGSGPRVLNGVIGERLVKIHSIATMFKRRHGVNEILNFSDTIMRKFRLIFSISSCCSMVESIAQDFFAPRPPFTERKIREILRGDNVERVNECDFHGCCFGAP